MNRLVTLAGMSVILINLFADVGLLMKYYSKPDAFSLMREISVVHAFFLYGLGTGFAWLKLLASLLMMACWARKLVRPKRVVALQYATLAYALLWALIGVMVLTGVIGTLQYAAGMDIALHDFSLLARSIGPVQLLSIVSGVVLFPLALMALPMLYNRTLPRA